MGMKLPRLPNSKSAIEVFGDFFKYLFRCTRSFIIDNHPGGASVWESVENGIQFVLPHPNGWEGAQQSKMRKAAIYAGLVPNTDEGKARVRFVTEGEASLHACVLDGLADDVLSVGLFPRSLKPRVRRFFPPQSPSQHGFVVADVGGGTLDISSYAVKGVSPLLIEEIAPPDCTSSFFFSIGFRFPFHLRSLLWFGLRQPPSQGIFGTQTQRVVTIQHASRAGPYHQTVR